MEFAHYLKLVRSLSFGKRLPEALYVHRCGFSNFSSELLLFLRQVVEKVHLNDFSFDLVKFHLREFKISLLAYPDFWDDPFPELKRSCSIDLITMKSRFSSYEKSENPPILHRKETFLPPNHNKIAEFSQLTQEAEAAGLFENTNRIGFKQNWLSQIKKKGYELKDGKLVALRIAKSVAPADNHDDGSLDEVQIFRHRTAINRNILSTPMQSLYQHGFLDGSYSVFDYGCGKGDDLRELEAHEIQVSGWDPVFRPETPPESADVVNLGFVINVIENPQERRDTLKAAFSLANKLLVVSVMLGSDATVGKFKPFGDGVVTARGTFQKYYQQSEIRGFIEANLEANAIAVGPGLFFVFSDTDEEQIFLSERQRRHFDWKTLTRREPVERIAKERISQLEKHQALIDDYKNVCLSLGRSCKPDEFEFSTKLRSLFGSFNKAWNYIFTDDPELFEQARKARIDDLLVYFGLNLFGRRKPYAHMPKSLQRDVKEFFGNYKNAVEEARALLFSVGSVEKIHAACIQANKQGLGYLDRDHSLQLHTSMINSLPAVLRLYVGCATQLFGDIDKADLVKIHIQSGKVSLMRYDDFVNKPLPQLLERIKIKMREQQIDFFDYTAQPGVQLLYLKTRYIPEDFPFYSEQKAFDDKLEKLDSFDFSRFGPPAKILLEVLERVGFKNSFSQ
jgi:DNA phosphorothioation-associated putative methyltransferase